MTPAERPKEKESNFLLVLLAKKVMKNPIIVANPAKRESRKGSSILEFIGRKDRKSI
jgi:hypothetical protein